MLILFIDREGVTGELSHWNGCNPYFVHNLAFPAGGGGCSMDPRKNKAPKNTQKGRFFLLGGDPGRTSHGSTMLPPSRPGQGLPSGSAASLASGQRRGRRQRTAATSGGGRPWRGEHCGPGTEQLPPCLGYQTNRLSRFKAVGPKPQFRRQL